MIKRTLSWITPAPSPEKDFHSWHYLRHNARRLEHLASLGLDLARSSVLEVGAGIGDHTHFFLDRECCVTTTDGRSENLKLLRERYPKLDVRFLDMDDPSEDFPSKFDIVYCYGLLYHLREPVKALSYMARLCTKLLLLETCVSMDSSEEINLCEEPAKVPSQAVSGTGCRPGRRWILRELRSLFPHVYIPTTQPWHEEFPLDWTRPGPADRLTRAIFIASRSKLDNGLLTGELVAQQHRH